MNEKPPRRPRPRTFLALELGAAGFALLSFFASPPDKFHMIAPFAAANAICVLLVTRAHFTWWRLVLIGLYLIFAVMVTFVAIMRHDFFLSRPPVMQRGALVVSYCVFSIALLSHWSTRRWLNSAGRKFVTPARGVPGARRHGRAGSSRAGKGGAVRNRGKR